MESDDDMHDANDVASMEEEDDYYSGDEEEEDYNYSYGEVEGEEEDDSEDFDFMANESDDVPVSRLQVCEFPIFYHFCIYIGFEFLKFPRATASVHDQPLLMWDNVIVIEIYVSFVGQLSFSVLASISL